MRASRVFAPVALFALLPFALPACSVKGVTPADGSSSSFAGTGGAGGGASKGGAGGASSGGAGGSAAGSAGASAMCTQVDDDEDVLANVLEGSALVPPPDTDKDGVPDFKDDDSDNDTWPDIVEGAECGKTRAPASMCVSAWDADGDGIPDFRSLDSDSDGVPDADERKYDPDGARCCRVKPDCDGDGAPDIVELAAGTDPSDPNSKPPDSFLYFIVPYQKPEQAKDFTFSTGVKIADIYFLIDVTNSQTMTISGIAASLQTTIIPTILNGDATAVPPIPPIPGAWIGAGAFRDVPWPPYGETGDAMYRNQFSLKGATVAGSVAAPLGMAPNFMAPANVVSILGSLVSAGGGDNPEAWMQALFMTLTGVPYAVSGQAGQAWASTPTTCSDSASVGAPCFRPNALPVVVLVTDAPAHNGPDSSNDYDPALVSGTVTYQQTLDAFKARGASVVGVAVDTGSPGLARADMVDLATKTGSLYHDPKFGGSDLPLVTPQDTATGDVSKEVVRLIGLLAGQGLHNVTTTRQSYDCAGMVDCDGDGTPDPIWHNPPAMTGGPPFDATSLITTVSPIPVTQPPTPYASLDETTFYGVQGDAKVGFRVHAKNDIVNPPVLMVVRALIRVKTPGGQDLGGEGGVKSVYLIIPRNPEAVPK